MSPEQAIMQQPQHQHLRNSYIVNIGSDISDDENTDNATASGLVVEELPSTAPTEFTREIRTIPGPDIEFTFPADGLVSDNVTLCGSWSNWAEHWNLTRDGVGSDLRVMVRGIPPGLHHFKVSVHGAV